MGKDSKIGWTDGTHNYLRGCRMKDVGCLRCYAMQVAAQPWLGGPGKPYAGLTQDSSAGPIWNGRIVQVPHMLGIVSKWTPRMVFSNSMSDWQYEGLEPMVSEALLQQYLATPKHVYQMLTKRDERQREFFRDRSQRGLPTLPPSIWVGVSVTHRAVLSRIATLRNTPGIAMRWVSFEPLLEDLGSDLDLIGMDWVVIGGESEQDPSLPARPMHTAWANRIIRLAQQMGIPVFFKQWGRWISKAHYPASAQHGDFGKLEKYLHMTGQWVRDAEIPRMPIVQGGADVMVKNGDQHFGIWNGAKLEEYPSDRFFTPELLQLRDAVATSGAQAALPLFDGDFLPGVYPHTGGGGSL